MPKVGSIGVSANTDIKQVHFEKFMSAHMRIVASIIQRKPWVFSHYVYVDLNAGAGCYANEHGMPIVGSPLIALDAAQRLMLPLWAFLCEADSLSCDTLRGELAQRGISGPSLWQGWPSMTHNIQVCEGDYRQTGPAILDSFRGITAAFYGVIYSDENGSLPPFDLLASFAQELHYCDIVIHVAATPIKRQFYSPIHPLMQRLDALMATVSKAYWIVREPYGRHQWTFLIGTNWESFPKFRKQGFWPIGSPEGASILRRLSFNREEYSGQGDLFST